MSSKTQKKAKTSRVVHAALGTEPDYSVKFTDQVRALQRVIADALSAPVEHDDDMNYSSAQKLVVWLDRGCRPIAPRDPKSAYRLIDLVSSRGRFFTFITLGLSALTAGWKENGVAKPKQQWGLLASANLPDAIKGLQHHIALVMESHCYTLLDDSVLSQEAMGHLTQLDGKPATVFEILFSEVY